MSPWEALQGRAVLLDRDGVLTETKVRDGLARAPLSLDDFRIIDGAADAVRRLRASGLPCIVVTNQPEVARGKLDMRMLDEMHAALRKATGVDDVLVCPHDESEGCACYKPRPGLALEAARKWGLDLKRCFVVGDRWRDVGLGRAVGARAILVKRPYSKCEDADANVDNLGEAADLILKMLELE